jgi:hypothetical protein
VLTLTFSEMVNDVALSDLSFGNATASALSGSGATYTLDLTPAGQGAVTATYLAGGAVDTAGNLNSASNLFSITYDSIAPTVTVNQASSQNDPTNTAPISFTVEFSEAVSGFSASDLQLAGTATATSVNISGTGPIYTVAVAGITDDGIITLSLPANRVADAAGNPNGASTSSDNSVTINRLPLVSSIMRSGTDPTNASSVLFAITFSETVTGVDVTDFTLATSGITGASITNLIGSGTSYTITVATGTGSGTIGLNLTDDDSIFDSASQPLGGSGTGNGNLNGQSFTIDKTDPQAQHSWLKRSAHLVSPVMYLRLNSAIISRLIAPAWMAVIYGLPGQIASIRPQYLWASARQAMAAHGLPPTKSTPLVATGILAIMGATE